MIPASPLEILQGVVQVAKRVYDQVQLVKSNKESWHSLVDLIKTVISSLEGLSTLPEQANFCKVGRHQELSPTQTIMMLAKFNTNQSKIIINTINR